MFLPKNPSESKAAFLARAAWELEAVYTKFAAQTGYIDYHRKQYSSEERRAMWIVAARLFRHSRQNTTSALKAYHGVSLKKTLNLERFIAIQRLRLKLR